MTGKFFAYMLSVFTFIFIFIFSVSIYIHIATRERINDICYDIAETISTRGMISSKLYEYFEENISCYGDYEVIMQIEKMLENGRSLYIYGIDQIKDTELDTGDRVIVSVIRKNQTIFEKISGVESCILITKTAIIN